MGSLCSRSEPDDAEKDKENTAIMSQPPQKKQRSHHDARTSRAHLEDMKSAGKMIEAQDATIAILDPAQAQQSAPRRGDLNRFESVDDYLSLRGKVLSLEKTLDFDYRCRANGTPEERIADAIIRRLRSEDNSGVYDQAAPRKGFGGQQHPRFAGDHFLSNVPLINQTAVFNVARHMPKGAHLHIHFNACLMPHVLLDIAKGMDRMFITSNVPLLPNHDYENFDRCEIQFSIMSPEKEAPGDLFSASYQPRQTMRFMDFLRCFPQKYSRATADDWLLNKLMFHEQEAHNHLQTAAGAWEKFNGRTKMMKGLFNYETAYRKYTRLCLEDFMSDNIQYAEIRPNFMTSNQLYHDDGTGPIDNWGIMNIIIDEVERFQAEMTRHHRFFGGLKVIYCTPRSFPNHDVKVALDECIEFKKRWPQWIAGFDLVGEEGKGRPIKDFIPELLEFQKMCRAANLEIPFLFHCGETLDMGTDTDGNLVDALLLNSRRIGHGFALSKHPYIMQHMKERNICLELCPISNEILGLTPRVNGHAMYQLLANNVHCTVSSDNGTLFRSSLSHDFYQTMVGKADMGLFGWKQLVMWSLEHACLDNDEYAKVLAQWEQQWERFVRWVISTYGNEK
ncbi:Fc.00g113680.m01.CDS01 [Cosmosporella sp. VM-42]